MRTFFLAAAVIASLCSAFESRADIVIGFDDLSNYSVIGPNGSYFDGHGAGASAGTWSTNGISFNTNQFGPGWSYSNVNNTTTAGFSNQWAAITGSGVGGSGNYVIGNSFDPGGAFFSLSNAAVLRSVAVTNATFSALSIRDGDSFAKAFGGPSGNDPDFFRVTFTGHSGAGKSGSVTGAVDFYLADYRFGINSQDYIINSWNTVDLTSLGFVQSVSIAFESSDNGAFGMNTPAYIALDNLTITAVPEPSSFALLGIAGSGIALWRRRRCKANSRRVLEGSTS